MLITIFDLGNVLHFHGRKMADTSKDGRQLGGPGGGIHHIRTTSVHVRKLTRSCLRTYYCLNTFIFGYISPSAPVRKRAKNGVHCGL